MSLPRTMRAAILMELRAPLVIDEVELPPALDVGQALVEIHYSGICGSQLGEIDGAKGADKYLPHLLGHEGSGTVRATGPGVRHVKAGDRVVLHWRKGDGIEATPPHYTWRGQPLNAGWVTTFNEYAVVSENRLTVIPADSDLEVAALFGCAVTTGFGIVENDAGVRIGESVVVFGAGGVGLNIVQAAALRAAWPIVAVDRFDNRLDLARQFGATHTINAATEDAGARLTAILGAAGADHFIDNTGNPAVIELGYRLTKPQGHVTLVGVPRQGDDIRIHSLPLHFGKRIAGSHGGDAEPAADIPRYESMHRSGRLSLRELISNVVALDRINDAIADLRAGRTAGRCLIAMR